MKNRKILGLFFGLLLLTLCPFSKAEAQTTYVVSVGIADYAYINDLRSTERDVAIFNEVMKTHTSHVNTLTGKKATHRMVYSALSNIFGKAKEEDIVIFYFSGHGFPGGFCCHDTKDGKNGLSYKELQTIFKGCKAKRKIVFADACYSGGMRNRGNSTSTETARNGNVMFFLSSRTGETSIERGKNGIYTQYLVRGLRGGVDSNKDRIITAKELYDFVHEGVIQASKQEQHPVMWGRFNDNMAIINWTK